MHKQDLLKMVMGGGFGPPPEVLDIFNAKGGGKMGLADKACRVSQYVCPPGLLLRASPDTCKLWVSCCTQGSFDITGFCRLRP